MRLAITATVGALIGCVIGAAISQMPNAEAHGDHPDIPDACEHACLHAHEKCVAPCKNDVDPNKCWMRCVKIHHDCFEGCHE